MESEFQISNRFRGGRSNAVLCLNRFLQDRLRRYSSHKNEPAAHATSDLSPYLHSGHISALEVALAAGKIARLLSQVLNGVLLPFVLVFMVLLINKRDLMGEWVNPRWANVVSWVAVVFIIGLTLAYVGILARNLRSGS